VSRTAALLQEISQLGVTLTKDGDQIVVDGPETVLTDAFVEKLRAVKADILRTLNGWDPADWRAFYDERAGIAEFNGQISRCEAELHAYECCITEWLSRYHERSRPGECAHCRQSDRSDHVIVPFGIERLVWLHPECWSPWHEARRFEAAVALTAMGIVRPVGRGRSKGRLKGRETDISSCTGKGLRTW
jgi:TubC N-terminal docking domain